MKFKSALMLSISLLLTSFILSGCNNSSNNDNSRDIPVSLSDEMLNRTYALTDNESQIVFLFDIAAHSDQLTAQGITDSSTIDQIEVRGSFNGWSATDALELTASSSEAGIWYLQVPIADINIPGNSGKTEYKFVVTSDEKTAWMNLNETAPDGYIFLGNHSIVTSADDIDTLIANDAQGSTIKTLADFDLSKETDQKVLSNFRQVPGIKNLYRSYHPFKQSRPEQETETTRIEYVNKLMAEYGMQSVITLSGDETATLDPDHNEVITNTMQGIIDAGNNLFLDIDYNLVYYRSSTAEFADAMKTIVEFIIDDSHPAPFLVHCRLGTDRTGVTSAILESCLGAVGMILPQIFRKQIIWALGSFVIMAYSHTHSHKC